MGGGLAGCSAALALSKSGVDAALFEAGTLPRHRVCGEFLSPESRATLARLGVLASLDGAGARPVGMARFCCDGQSADFPLGEAAGLAISRFALDPLLIAAVKSAGGRVFLGCKTRQLQRVGDGYEFEAGGQKWRARSVILAAGRAMAPRADAMRADAMRAEGDSLNNGRARARFCGFKAHFGGVDLPVGEVEMHLFRGGYCGLVRVEGEATNVCLLLDYKTLRGQSPQDLWARLGREIPALSARFRDAQRLSEWHSTGNVGFGLFRPSGERSSELAAAGLNPIANGLARGALCAGDAAGYIHPLTGDGMAMALRAGELAATVARLVVGGLDIEAGAQLYRAAWEREFDSRLQLAAQLHPLALRPQWARPILPILRHFPALAKALTKGTRGASF